MNENQFCFLFTFGLFAKYIETSSYIKKKKLLIMENQKIKD